MKAPSARRCWLATACMLACGVLAVLWWSRSPLSVEAWQARIALTPEHESSALLKLAADSGPAGIRALAATLGDSRPAVRQAAGRLLLAELDRWELLPPAEALERLRAVADQLAETQNGWTAAERAVAAEAASRMMLWPTAQEVLDERFIAQCERIMRACGSAGPVDQAHWFAGDVRLAQPLHVAAANPQPPAMPPLPTDIKPGAALAAQEPRRLPDATSAAPLTERMNAPGAEDHTAADQDAQVDANRPAALASQPENPALASGRAMLTQAAADIPPLEGLSIVELYRLRRGGNPVAADAVAAEFRRRGFSDAQINAGEALTHPDADVRRRWVAALPSMTGLDAKPWLLWASRDESASVREAALGLMGASTEAEMLRRVEEMSRLDSDANIRSAAAGIVKHHDNPQR